MCERFDQYRPILARVDFGWKLFNFGDECMRSARLVSSQHVSTAEEMMVVERTRNSEREKRQVLSCGRLQVTLNSRSVPTTELYRRTGLLRGGTTRELRRAGQSGTSSKGSFLDATAHAPCLRTRFHRL